MNVILNIDDLSFRYFSIPYIIFTDRLTITKLAMLSAGIFSLFFLIYWALQVFCPPPHLLHLSLPNLFEYIILKKKCLPYIFTSIWNIAKRIVSINLAHCLVAVSFLFPPLRASFLKTLNPYILASRYI